MSTVSVVVPSLNDARMLEGCLADLASQTRPADEVIVVDNGSTDDTQAVAAAHGAVAVVEPEHGVLRATARGFDAATGDVIGRLDADSRPASDWVERLADRFDADPTLGALTGTGTFYGCGPVARFLGAHVYLGGYFWFMGMIIGRTPLFGSNFALRREAWRDARERIHLDDPRAHDDLDISFVLDPAVAVDYDPDLHVGVSARPLESVAGMRRRAAWAFHVVGVNWAEVSWPRRVAAASRARRLRRAEQRSIGEPPPVLPLAPSPAGEREHREGELMRGRLAGAVPGAQGDEGSAEAFGELPVGLDVPHVAGAGRDQDGDPRRPKIRGDVGRALHESQDVADARWPGQPEPRGDEGGPVVRRAVDVPLQGGDEGSPERTSGDERTEGPQDLEAAQRLTRQRRRR